MKRSFLFAVMILLGVHSAIAVAASFDKPAKQPFYFDLYLLNSEARFERGINQDLVSRNSIDNFAVGGRYGSTAAFFEYALFNHQTGNTTLSILNTRREYLLWWKETLHRFEYVDLYSALGIGGYQEEITTRLGTSSALDHGDSSVMAGAGFGVQALVFDHLILSLEPRLIAGSNFDPNPTVGVIFRSGLEF